MKFHIIWVTKYRYKVLRGEVATRTLNLLRQICQRREVVILQGSVSPDHVHMLVSVPPQLVATKPVQVPQRSVESHAAGRVSAVAQVLLGSTPLGPGVLLRDVGAVDEDTIRRYIENQQWDDPGEKFKITASAEP